MTTHLTEPFWLRLIWGIQVLGYLCFMARFGESSVNSPTHQTKTNYPDQLIVILGGIARVNGRNT